VISEHVRCISAAWPSNMMHGAQRNRKIDCPIKMASPQQLAYLWTTRN